MTVRLPTVHYEQVAEVFMEAADVGEAPLVAIADTWGVPRTTAARWVKRAKELGLDPGPVGRCRGRCAVHCKETAA